MKKSLVFLIICALLIRALALPVSAEEGLPDLTAEGVEEQPGEAESTKENAFHVLYLYIEEHASEIFSALAFFGSVIIVLVYKRGLLPALTSSIGKVSSLIGSFLDNAKKSGESTSTALTAVTDGVAATKEALDSVTKKLESLTERLASAEQIKSEEERIRTVLEAEIDMLYDIFSASSLPQYRKDLIGERVAKMKSLLGGINGEEADS